MPKPLTANRLGAYKLVQEAAAGQNDDNEWALKIKRPVQTRSIKPAFLDGLYDDALAGDFDGSVLLRASRALEIENQPVDRR